MLVLQGPKIRVESLVFSPDGAKLVAPRGDTPGVSCWDLAAGGTKPEVWLDNVRVRSVEFTPDGKRLLACGQWVFLCGFDGEDGTEVKFPEPYSGWATAAFTPNGKRLIATLSRFMADPPVRLVCRSVADPQTDLWSVDVPRYTHMVAMFLPGGRRFLTVEWWNEDGGDGHGPAFTTRDARTGKVVAEVREQGRGDHGYVMSADRNLLAARARRELRAYRTDDFSAPLATIKNTTRKEFTGMAFHPSGRYLAATSNDETVKLYDTATWKPTRTLSWKAGKMRSVAFSQDGSLAAAGTDKGQVVVWDVDL